MRIGLIAPPWYAVPPHGYGGTEAVVDRLARGLTARGHDVVLFTTGDSTCPVERRWAFPRALEDWMGDEVLEIRHLVRAYREMADVDVVHDHTLLGPLFAEMLPGVPVVVTNHGPFEERSLQIYRLADEVGVIAISHDQAASARDVPVLRVIHHGLNPEAFQVGDGSGGYLLFLGRMAPDKGVREAALVAREAGRPLLIAAKMREEAEQQYFEEKVRPLLDDDVRYIGEVDEPEKLRLLRQATALVNPISWPEPFGLVMVEALACGTPVLAFPSGAAPEIVEHGRTGFLCEDVTEMARRVPDAAALDRAACRRPVEEYFSTDRMVTDHLRVYEQLVGGRNASSGQVVAS
jgi:glycosyltransferase involved in cell wall biosynthesis